jgi:hypothetical protein
MVEMVERVNAYRILLREALRQQLLGKLRRLRIILKW